MFAQWLLDVGKGTVGGVNDGQKIIEIPQDLLIKEMLDPISELIDFVYPYLSEKFQNSSVFHERRYLFQEMMLFKK
jgi:hypothetical protein